MSKENNERMIKEFLEAADNFNSAILSSFDAFNKHDDYLYRKFNVNTLYVRNFTIISEDLLAVNKSFTSKIPFFSTPQPDISNWVTTVEDIYVGISAFLDINHVSDKGGLIVKLVSCVGHEDNATCKDDSSSAPTYLYYKRNILKNWINHAQTTMHWLDTMETNYNSTVKFLFEDTDFEYENIKDHHICVSTLFSIVSFWKPLLNDLINVYRPMYLTTNDINFKIVAANAFQSFYLSSQGSSKISEILVEPCNWFIKKNWADVNYTSFEISVNEAFHVFPVVSSLEDSIYSHSKQMYSDIKTYSDPFIIALNKFLDPEVNTTKTSLALLFNSNEARAFETLVASQLRNSINEFNQLSNKIYDLHNNLRNAYKKSFYLVVPAVNDQLIARLYLTQTCQKMVDKNKDDIMKKHLENILTAKCESVKGLVSRSFDKYKFAVQEVQRKLIRRSKEFDSSLASLRKNFDDYIKQGCLDQNFIRLKFHLMLS